MRNFCTLFLLSLMSSVYASEVDHLLCEYLSDPVGIDVINPRMSWQMIASEDASGITQTAYQIQVVNKGMDFGNRDALIWDSGKIERDQSQLVAYAGPQLSSRTRYYWRVKIWDNQGVESDWSDPAFWEMGILDTTEWKATWIGPGYMEDPQVANPAPLLRKSFELPGQIEQARLYITSHGLYQASINGTPVSKDLFTPGWTSYEHRLQYQTYDVTALLQAGANAIGVQLGDGWYRGKFGFAGGWNLYGDKLALLCQLEVVLTDGSTLMIVSDDSWKSATGPIRMSGLYDGEVVDARLERMDWNSPGYDDEDWKGVSVSDHSLSRLIAPQGPPVRAQERITPRGILTTPEGDLVVDMGQNMVGWVRITLQGQEGDTVTLWHAEVLDKEGNFYTENLRDAEQKVKYILADAASRTFEPTFTFQGFRFVKIEGLRQPLKLSDVEGVVIYSQMPRVGEFSCSNPLINQLQQNIQWGQRGNFLDVPTDCPQRDERMGWTGDAQAFAATACYNFQTAAFYTKWLGDVRADQRQDGAIPFVVPNVLGENAAGSTGWGDVATILPWMMYLKYGDRRILANQYENMRRWVDFLDQLAGDNHLIQDGFHFGDWLFFIHPTDWNNKPGYSDIDFLATSFFAYSTSILIRVATLLGEDKDAMRYQDLYQHIRSAWQKEFVTSSGRLSPHTQTAYTLALAFDLLEPDDEAQAVNYLVQNIEQRDYHLSTGFLGTPHLCHVLSEHGHTDVAYRLLLQEFYPSWLYPVTRGATTVWERWDGIKPDSTFQTPRMNSFNHYAYGAIGDWMYSVAAGIQTDPEQPGYKHIVFRPHPSPDLEYVSAAHQSPYGEIKSAWKYQGEMIEYTFTVPPNTTATIALPGTEAKKVGSGTYHYAVERPQ